MAKQDPINPVAPYLAPRLLDGPDWGTPLVALLAQPVWFDGRAVRVPGFLGIRFECVALYLGEADYRHRLMANSVWVNLPQEISLATREYHERYVLIDGVFRVGPTGHRGGWASELTEVSRVIISRGEGWLLE